MATFVRSKSCSSIPPYLPMSELILEIEANRRKIIALHTDIALLASEVALQLESLKSSTGSEIKFLQAQIYVLQRDIGDLRYSLDGMEHQVIQNSKDIKRLNQHLQALIVKVDSLFETKAC